jgi:hypothetical protein
MAEYRIALSLDPDVEALLCGIAPLCRGCPPDTRAVFNAASPRLAALFANRRRPCPCVKPFPDAAAAQAWTAGLTRVLSDLIVITPADSTPGVHALALTWKGPADPVPALIRPLCRGCPPDTRRTEESLITHAGLKFGAALPPEVYQFSIPDGDFAQWWGHHASDPFFDDLLVLPLEIPS